MRKISMTALGIVLLSSMAIGQEGKAVVQVAVEQGKTPVQADSLKKAQNLKQQAGDSTQQKGGARSGENSQHPEAVAQREKLQEKGAGEIKGASIKQDLQNSQDPEAVEYRQKQQKKDSLGVKGQAGQVELKNSQDPEAVRERKKQQKIEEKGGAKPQEKKPDDPEV